MKVRSLRPSLDDLRDGAWRVLPRMAAGHLMPGVLRTVLLRAAGLDVRSRWISGSCTFTDRLVHIDRGTYVNEGCFFEARAPISVGRDSLIGPGVSILTSTHSLQRDNTFERQSHAKPVTIGIGCWIGANVTILPGVTIADRVVVGAGSVVTKDLQPGRYAGNPAKLLSP